MLCAWVFKAGNVKWWLLPVLTTLSPSRWTHFSEKAKAVYQQQPQLCSSIYRFFQNFPSLVYSFSFVCRSSSLYRQNPDLCASHLCCLLTWNLSPMTNSTFLNLSFSAAFFVLIDRCLWLSLHTSNLAHLKMRCFLFSFLLFLQNNLFPQATEAKLESFWFTCLLLHISCIRLLFPHPHLTKPTKVLRAHIGNTSSNDCLLSAYYLPGTTPHALDPSSHSSHQSYEHLLPLPTFFEWGNWG